MLTMPSQLPTIRSKLKVAISIRDSKARQTSLLLLLGLVIVCLLTVSREGALQNGILHQTTDEISSGRRASSSSDHHQDDHINATSSSTSTETTLQLRNTQIIGISKKEEDNQTTTTATSHQPPANQQPVILPANTNNKEDVVSSFCHSQQSAFGIWQSLQAPVREASYDSLQSCWPDRAPQIHPRFNHSGAAFHRLTKRMFHQLSAHRLKKSIKFPPNPLVTEKALEIILKRIQDPQRNPPLRIAVFGGSVTVGFEAHENDIGLPFGKREERVDCAWPMKLQHVLNKMLPALFGNPQGAAADVVEVHNFAVPGTDSLIGGSLLEYDLWHSPTSKLKGKHFDVFVSAFSSNDGRSAKEELPFIYESMQVFLRNLMDQRPCSDLPLVIQLEDVPLESQTPYNVKDYLWFARQMGETSAWTGTSVMAVSFADAIREFVLTHPQGDATFYKWEELHPGLSFHTGVSWVVAYNLLSGLLDSCDAKTMPQYHDPEPRVGFAPPMLTDSTHALSLHEEWNRTTVQKRNQCQADPTGTSLATKCIYKWIAAKQATSSKEKVQKVMSRVATHIQGWKAEGHEVRKPRRTWRASEPGASFVIQLDKIRYPVNQFFLLYLKSYGPDWENTELAVLIEGRAQDGQEWEKLHTTTVKGVHNAETSINYTHKVKIKQMEKGSSIRASFSLINGRQFQINGIAFCNTA